MERAKVGIFEDVALIRDGLRGELEHAEHTVELEVATMVDAREEIAQLQPGALDVAVVDGNLASGTKSGQDGAEITALLKGVDEAIRVIGYSGSANVAGADVNFPKAGAYDILNYIAALPDIDVSPGDL